MTNEEFQRLVLQELGNINESISKLEKGQQAIQEDVSVLKEDVSVLKEDVSVLKEDVSVLKEDVFVLKEDVYVLKEDVNTLKDGQNKIRTLIEDLEPKNASRHIEIVTQIDTLRGDLNSIEVITSKNWNDIAILKSVK